MDGFLEINHGQYPSKWKYSIYLDAKLIYNEGTQLSHCITRYGMAVVL